MLVWLCLGQGADLHMAQLMPLHLTISCSSKSRLVLPFWCWLTRVVPDRIQQGRKTVVCVCVLHVFIYTLFYVKITNNINVDHTEELNCWNML